MARLASTLLVLALLVGTAAAFAITESLKLETSPITGPRVAGVFSPVCGCETDTAEIRFRLRRADVLTLSIVDSEENVVRTLVERRAFRPRRLRFEWDGRSQAGGVVPDGSYRPRVELERLERTILLPTAIDVDTTPPHVNVTRVRPRVFSPDGDGKRELVHISYVVDETARPLLYVDGRRVTRGRLVNRRGKLRWFGRRHREGLPAASYLLTLRAEDVAGNVSTAARAAVVRIRYAGSPE